MAPRRLPLAGAVLAAALAAPAAASAAAVVAPSAPCVRYIDTIPAPPTLGVASSGWTAGATLTFKVGDRIVGTGTADAAGAFSTGTSPFAPPEPPGNLRTMTLTATGSDGQTAQASVRVVRVGVQVPRRAKPSKRVRYRAFGFVPGKRLYLFVRRGGKTKGRFTLGKPHGDCGTLKAKLRYMPLKRWSTGRYEYWYSHDRRYSKKTRIYGYSITIFKTLR